MSRQFWSCVAPLVVCATVLGSTPARAQQAGSAFRPRVVSPPTQAPAVVEARGRTGRIDLEWSGVRGASGYRIFRNDSGTWTPVATVGRQQYSDRQLTNGILRTYRIAALNRAGIGPQSADVSATPLAVPAGLDSTPGAQQITLAWQAVAGATGYIILRSLGDERPQSIATPTTPNFTDTGLVDGLLYTYRVRATAANSRSAASDPVTEMPGGPVSPPTAAPTLTATSGDAFVDLSWTPVAGAANYKLFRVDAGSVVLPPIATVAVTSFRHQPLTNGAALSYQVAATNAGGDGPLSNVASATPAAPLGTPTNVRAVAGDGVVTLSWTPVTGATSYRVYRGTATDAQGASPLTPDPTTASFTDRTVTNNTTYFYKVTAAAGGLEGPRSLEVNATPRAATSVDLNTLSAFRLLRQATWGPKPGDVDRVRAMGAAAFVDEQLAMAPSTFPDSLFSESVEAAQEHWMHTALSGPDQLRQRVAWALHKILVVSAADAAINRTTAIVPYYRLLLNGAFGSYRDVLRSIALNAAMGRYLNMLNNRRQTFDATGAPTSPPPNENFARELLQLFVWGTSPLNPDGTPVAGSAPTYTEADVKALARILTGWTFGDGNPATLPTAIVSSGDYRHPMEPVESQHDRTAKTFMGAGFAADIGASAELDHVLDIVFAHPNTAPFISRQLIQQLVTSNPRTQYVADIAAVFSSSGGNLGAVVRAILLHPDARGVQPTPTKLSEPVLFGISVLRGLNATVTDFPFLSDLTPEMGQNVFFPPSVFSYYSPGFRVPNSGTPPLVGPEFQILTSVTSLERANFVGRLLGGQFGSAVTIDYTAFNALAPTPDQLIEHVNQLFMGGRMSSTERDRIRTAVAATNDMRERVRTALYVTLVAAQAQVDQ